MTDMLGGPGEDLRDWPEIVVLGRDTCEDTIRSRDPTAPTAVLVEPSDEELRAAIGG